ncbi:LysR family transcriptional regulator [Kitasatospora aureofaciens]|uniref:LysR family transcriptional regulator n=1 Tax=Kitasatospora aureofaciens TaxID=1894 RepID=A0A1E7N048_KITAU|nr:LysR family transcriptional regulator [Kitasatospora aureofaciens]ARF80315.1 LysR family transcriptional regulator [Kitasatospora aureofaciens]OEV33843.1 LysR family transcriptional regulator [Kitasatospora aureofaciens]GGV02076.1 LysR family transcriptional regulator [Kitasatospora aureofaciens]
MMDLGRLRALHAVAVHGSVGRAAAALGFTPSAVSQQIAKLERETRTVLLERQGRGVVLTDAARELAATARTVLGLMERAEVRLEEQRGQAVGRLLVAAFATGARGLMPGVLAELRRRCPEVDVRLLESDPYPAAELVGRGEVDLALVQDWPSVPLPVQEGLSRLDLGTDPVDLVLPADDDLAALDAVPVERLRGQRWISVPPGNICHDWLVRTLREAGEEPDVRYQVDDFETQIALVAAGLGMAVVPRLGRGPLPAGVAARPVASQPSRRVFALWRAQASRRPAITEALAVMKDCWAAVEEAQRRAA